MFCVPRSSSPIDVRASSHSTPTPSLSKKKGLGFFAKDSSLQPPPSPSHSTPTTPLKRSRSSWFDLVRTTGKPKSVEASHGSTGEADMLSVWEAAQSQAPPSEPTVKSFPSLRGINWRQKEQDVPRPKEDVRPEEPEDDEEEEDTDAVSVSDAASMNSLTIGISADCYPPSSSSIAPPPPAYPIPTRTRLRPCHTNLLQITTSSLHPPASPHPLIMPRSSKSTNSSTLFPRSCNLAPLPRPRSLLVALHKTRVIRRLEQPGSLTASEELSIMPFLTRLPGTAPSFPSRTKGIYPSSSYRSSYLSIDEADSMREVDVNNRISAQGFPDSSKGLKRWLQRPAFEQRAAVWTGAEYGCVKAGIQRRDSRTRRPAPLCFSEGLEALAGIVRQKRRNRWYQAVSQVMPPLHHPKPLFYKPPTLHIPPPPLLSASPASSASTDTAPNTPNSNSSSAPNLGSLVPPAFLHRLNLRNSRSYVDTLEFEDEDDVPLGAVVITKRTAQAIEEERERRLREKEAERERRRQREQEKMRRYKDQILSSRARREVNRTGGKVALEEEWVEVDSPASVLAPKPAGSKPVSSRTVKAPQPQSQPSNRPSSATSGSLKAPSIRAPSVASSNGRAPSIASSNGRPPSVASSNRSQNPSSRTQHAPSSYTHAQQQQAAMMMAAAAAAATQGPQMFYVVPQYAAQNPGMGAAAMGGYVQMPPTFFVPPPPPAPHRSASNGDLRKQGMEKPRSARRASVLGESPSVHTRFPTDQPRTMRIPPVQRAIS